MSKYVLTNAKIYVDNYDISGDSNAGSLSIDTSALDATTFGNTTRVKVPGLDDIKASVSVIYDNTTAFVPADEMVTWRSGMTAKNVTIGPTTGADGEVAWCFKGVSAGFDAGMAIGEVMKGTWNLECVGNTGLMVQGRIMKNATAGVAAGGNGTAYELGLLDTGHTLYSVLHVYSINGGTLVVTVASDSAENFPSATTRLTHTNATTTTSEWSTLAGPVATDTWWRCTYTYDGTLVKFVHTVAIV